MLSDSFVPISDSNFFNGTIDEVRIYNQTLTTTEIGELYNNSQNLNNLLDSEVIGGFYISSPTNQTYTTRNILVNITIVNKTCDIYEDSILINSSITSNYTAVREYDVGSHNISVNCTDNATVEVTFTVQGVTFIAQSTTANNKYETTYQNFTVNMTVPEYVISYTAKLYIDDTLQDTYTTSHTNATTNDTINFTNVGIPLALGSGNNETKDYYFSVEYTYSTLGGGTDFSSATFSSFLRLLEFCFKNQNRPDKAGFTISSTLSK